MTKTVFITGCSSGIGYCAATTLAKRGYRVFAGIRKITDQERLKNLNIETVLLDVNDSASIKATVETLLAQTEGKLDALINNAGFCQPGALEDLSREALRRQFETNIFGLQELTNLIIPVMRTQGYGRIVNISSLLGYASLKYRGAYTGSKFALEGMSDTLRLELRGTGIEVILIEPGPINSNIRDKARAAFENAVNIEHSPHRETYEQLSANYHKNAKSSPFAKSPEAVVKKIILALESRRPKLRYYVTVPAYVLAFFKRVLPHRWLDAVLIFMSKQ